MAFILTTIAGLSTLLGIIPIFLKIKNQDKIINISLSFASGVMISASIFDLIPEGYKYFNTYYNFNISILLVFIYLIFGVIISIFINKNIKSDNYLYKLGISSMLIIMLHNIPEGIITYLTSSINISIGIKLTLAIIIHNIPEGITISVPIYYSTKSKKKAILYTLIAAVSEPLGGIIAYIFFKNIINNYLLGLILSIISGLMIYISIYELLKEAYKYKNKKISILSLIIGLIFMYISIKLISF